jgi:hypothetical protein
MFKVAMLATALLVAVSTAAVEGGAFEPVGTPTTAPACHPGPAAALACATRGADADGDGVISAAELANFTAPAPLADATSLHSGQGAGLDFKEAAIESAGTLRSSLDREHPQPLIPALVSIGALMILLRRRPT